MRVLNLVQKIQKEDDNEALVELLDIFEPKIKKSLRTVKYMNKEDIRQEIKIRIICAVRKYKFDEINGIEEFL
ncbi:helix-turn-helix domain-containing protein [Paenibacillus sp. B1-33]|uniref:helix-turn-helix domain-containing protein n=1 Tax=unclassified Paenibacillus TaxID=185978 RepID=UPI003D280417